MLGTMAGRKRQSAEDIVGNCAGPMDWIAQGRTGEQMTAEVGVSLAPLYNCRRRYGDMETDEADRCPHEASPAIYAPRIIARARRRVSRR